MNRKTVQWLEGCADKWAGCPAAFANTPQIEDKSNG